MEQNFDKKKANKKIIDIENAQNKEQKKEGQPFRQGQPYTNTLTYKGIENQEIKQINFKYKSNNKQKTPLKVWENVDQLLKANNITVKFNNISKEIEINSNSENRTIDDEIVELNTLTLNNGLNTNMSDLLRFTKRISHSNAYNPVTDYLIKCKNNWDGVERVEKLCNTITTEGDIEWKNFLITKWLVNTVHIAFNSLKDGLNTEGILVIQGEQGLGKTRWIESIIPIKEWLKTGVTIDPSNKDSIMKCTKYWVVELGELDATFKKEQSILKQFFTESVDEYRTPYSLSSERYPRLTSFYATVNRVDFLKDDTGNRRYWTINATSINWEHGIDINQLWGEVMYLYSSGKVKHYLEPKDIEKLTITNEISEEKTSIEIKILDMFRWNIPIERWEQFSVSEICDYINENNVRGTGRIIKKMMRNNENIKFNSNGRKYLLPPKITDFHRK